MNDWRERAGPHAASMSETPTAPDDGLTAIRSVFFEEAVGLLESMASRLGSLAEDLGDATGLAEIADGGHTLRGSAALAQLPTLSHVGAVLERAADLASKQAERNHDAARALVRETLAALGPARRMIDHARAGYDGVDESLIREMHETFSPAYQDGLRRDADAVEDEVLPGVIDEEASPEATDEENAPEENPPWPVADARARAAAPATEDGPATDAASATDDAATTDDADPAPTGGAPTAGDADPTPADRVTTTGFAGPTPADGATTTGDADPAPADGATATADAAPLDDAADTAPHPVDDVAPTLGADPLAAHDATGAPDADPAPPRDPTGAPGADAHDATEAPGADPAPPHDAIGSADAAPPPVHDPTGATGAETISVDGDDAAGESVVEAKPSDESEPAFDAELAASLAEVFQEELKDLLADVPDLLTGLVDPAEQLNLCADLGRIFHTVKGSAATVGQTAARDLGLTLQDAFEGPSEDPDLLPLRPEFASQIADPLREIFLTAGLEPPVAALELLYGMANASVVDADDAAAEVAELATAPPEEGDAPPGGRSSPPGPTIDPAVEPEIMEAFALDADAALEACEGALVAFEKTPTDRAPLRILFRQFHTLKGAAAAVGLDRIAEQLHAGETLLENAVEHGLPGAPERFTQLLLEMLDSVTGLIEEARGTSHDHRILSDVDARIAEVLTQVPTETPAATAPPPTPPTPAPSPATSAPSPTNEGESAIVRVHASRLDLLMNRVSELVVSRTRMDDALLSINDMRDKLNLDRMQLSETIEGFRSFEFNSVPSAGGSEDGESGGSTTPDEFTDLEFDKYDDFNVLTRTLVELAADTGEMLEQLTRVLDGLGEEGRQISKISSSLQRTVSAMRLQSLDTLFRRLQRSIRDAARNAEREVEVETIGGEVQLDRGLIESLYGPLLHVVRNAVSHGIEAPEDRARAGKAKAGRVTLEAVQRQGSVEIVVRDDGRGLDFDAIRAKAERLGMLPPGHEPERDELAQMIFRPGFSTKEQVTDLAGRGIGMDVVASEVEQLRGTVAVDSRDGAGTSFGITLPLAAMIEQVLVLRAGDQSYALSQAPIETVLCIEPEHVVYDRTGTKVRVGEAMLPALSLTALTGQPSGHPSTALVVQQGEDRVAVLVDRIEAQREAVIRPLGRLFSGHPFITSATFAGDGQVVFVLDASRLPALARQTVASAPRAFDEDRLAPTRPTNATVLWADDSISVRKLAGLFLSAEGWSAETAVDGIDALEKLRKGHFQVVVTDLEMPRMHGYELLQEVRADPRLADLPVVVCSSRSSEKHRRRAREAGANGYLTKPFTQEALATVLRDCLGETEEDSPSIELSPPSGE